MKKFLLSIFALMLTVVSTNAQETAELSFANKAQRTVFNSNQQVWVQNGITLTNNKSKSTNAVADYANPARFYKGSEIIVEFGQEMTQIDFACNSTTYANALKSSIGASASVSGKIVTVAISPASNSYTIANLSGGQVRMDKLTVTYTTSGEVIPATESPVISPEPCSFTESLEVAITAEEGTIYYTLDGTDPTTESNVFTENFTIEKTTTVKAIAVAEGKKNSSIATATYTKHTEGTIAEVIAAGIGTAKTAGTVVATYTNGFLMSDETGYILVYKGTAAIGDVVTVEGSISEYAGLLQFGAGSTVEKTGTAEVTYPEVTVMDGAAMDAYLAAPYVKYVEYTGVLTISGNYYNVAIEGATKAQGSISYPTAGLVTAKSGETVRVTGYTIGVSSSKYVNTMAVKVEKIEPLVPTSVVRTNKAVEYQLKGVQLMFDEVVTATAPENSEYGYVLNAAGEKVFTFDKMSGGTGVGKFASFSNSDYSAVIETPGEYKVVITTVITGESGKVYKGGEYAFTVTKHPVEVERSVEFWGTVKTLPLNIDITINYADVIVLDETKKVTYITGETTYEAVVTKVENVISIAFDENVEYAEGDYTFNVPAGLYTADGEANEAIAEEFTYKKPVPLKVLEIQPAEGEVESISTITILFNQTIEPNYMFEMSNRMFMRTNGWEASAVVEYTACDGNGEPSPITEAGEYVFDVTFVTDFLAEGEKTTYTWTIAAPVEPEPEVIPAANKLYTVVAEGHSSGAKPQWAINDEGTKFVSSGDNTISTDEQKQFAFVTFNDAKYIYSISAKKFVLKDGSLAEKTGDAIEITDLGNGKYFFRFDASHNVNIGGSKQMVIDGWSAVDGGNQFTLAEAGEFDPAEALAALNSTVEVVYVYMYNGVEVGRTTVKDEVGNAYPAVVNVPFGFTANTPEGVIEAAGEVAIECALVENYPIKYAASVEEIDTWYYMQMHSNQKKYIQYLADQAYLEWADAEVAEGEEDSYTWAFVGDPANGFKLVNYAAGKEMAVCSDGSNDPALGAFADAVVWKPAYSKETGNDAYFCLQFPGGNYMNAQSGKVAYWSDNDAGSTFLLTEREITVVELEALELASYEKNPNNNAKKLQGVKLNFNEAVKKYTTETTGDYGYIRDAEGNEVAKLTKVMGANGTATYATPYATPAIEMGGTYTVVVNSGVFLSADGTKEYKGGEFEFVVEATEPYFYPSAEEGFCYNETFERVEDFKEFTITVKYAKEVILDAEKKVTMTCGENVYEAVVTLEEVNAITKEIKIAFDGEFAEGRYTIDVPAGLFTIDGVANDEFAQSTFRYALPQLEITRDFDTWESYLDQVWYMPTAAMITIANAESVVVDETKVATIAVGEKVYNSTLNWYYDEWSNAYYIEYQFEDFFAEGFEFVKGDYTFTLPAGAYTVNGVANEEAVKTYTYGDPIVEEFTVTEVIPAPGSVLESIDAISITFSNGMAADYLPVTCGDKTYYFVSMRGIYVPVDMNTYEPIVITEPGTYTLDLSALEGLTGEKVFTWTIGTVEPEPGVDYTPRNTGTVTRTDRNVTAVTLNESRFDLLTNDQSMCYVDATETVTFTVAAGSTLKAAVEHKGEWVHHSVYIDFEGDGFTSGLEEGSEWKPAGDLVAYSFYNNGGSSDEYGYNSVGTYMSGEDRHMPEIPEFTAPTEPGLYRMRFVQDWCSIDPMGDADGRFGDFMDNGGQIIDVMLEVTVADGISEVNGENGNVKTIYDLTGRKIETITKPGIYIVGGRKVLVK